jgi:hypothetical protein
MKLFLILPIIYSLNLMAMGDPTFVPGIPNVKEAETKKPKKQMQQEPKPNREIKNSQKATKGDL